MVQRLLSAVSLIAGVSGAIFLIAFAADLALKRDAVQLFAVSTASALSANYAVDESPITFAPLSPEIIPAVVADQATLAAVPAQPSGNGTPIQAASTPQIATTFTPAAAQPQLARPTSTVVVAATPPVVGPTPIATLPLPTVPLPTLPAPTETPVPATATPIVTLPILSLPTVTPILPLPTLPLPPGGPPVTPPGGPPGTPPGGPPATLPIGGLRSSGPDGGVRFVNI